MLLAMSVSSAMGIKWSGDGSQGGVAPRMNPYSRRQAGISFGGYKVTSKIPKKLPKLPRGITTHKVPKLPLMPGPVVFTPTIKNRIDNIKNAVKGHDKSLEALLTGTKYYFIPSGFSSEHCVLWPNAYGKNEAFMACKGRDGTVKITKKFSVIVTDKLLMGGKLLGSFKQNKQSWNLYKGAGATTPTNL